MEGFRFNEKYLSQIPALQLLINSGWEYLPPSTALVERKGKRANFLLEGILETQLKEINRIQFKGEEFRFSEENIQSAIQELKSLKYEGLQRTNEVVYDLLTLPISREQTIEGHKKSYDLKYIDWKNWKRNKFHVSAEFSLERMNSHEQIRPDIVLFVNGIPLGVIECKAPNIEVEQSISQMLRNQTNAYAPHFFAFIQLVVATNKNKTLYGTSGTPTKFWGLWREREDREGDLEALVNRSLYASQKEGLFSDEFAPARTYFESQEESGPRVITEQDRSLHALCRPERFMDLVFRFTLFDAGIKKIARYQQYFVVKAALQRVKGNDHGGNRQGGIVWHTQGSGKSLTMVWLARSLALDSAILNPRILLVTDRKDLDKQLGNTFIACGLASSRARNSRELLRLVKGGKASIINTLIHKFEKAHKIEKHRDDSRDIFMLVDEGHRSNYGSFAARMRQMFPNACYIGFTGTPLLKKDKSSIAKFGGLIEPHYSIQQAVKDGAVVPLLYEGRHVELEQNQTAIDLWFERHTQGLNDAQKADLKKKYARSEMLNKADQVIYMRAFDISEHFRAHWQGTGFKSQLVAPGKSAALKYQAFLKDIGILSSEVIISGPDQREGYEDFDEAVSEIQKFWDKMMERYGSEEAYNQNIINQFNHADDPEILIVVDKLLTGVDSPRNTVLYVCKSLREHTLLQAIARVNRLFEDEETGLSKEFGYIIDYVSILGELDQAMSMYAEAGLDGFDEDDIAGALKSINDEVKTLPQRYADLWDFFKTLKNQQDEEAFELFLEPEEKRKEFYELLSSFARTLGIALSSEQFLMSCEEEKLNRYKADLKRFQKLKAAVQIRYAESIDYKDYEPKIKKLLDIHIQSNEVLQLNKPVNIFDDEQICEVMEEQGIYEARPAAARADAIANAMKRSITEKMEEDPAYYTRFSKMIQQAIEDYKAKRLSDLEYLNRARDIRDQMVNHKRDGLPEAIKERKNAQAYFGVAKVLFDRLGLSSDRLEETSLVTALAVDHFFQTHWKVDFWDDPDAKKRVINEIDDFLFDEIKDARGIALSTDQMDELIEKIMQVAERRLK